MDIVPGDSTKEDIDIAFGPVPSRRFGMSLGINNIPKKTCSYSCIYCQVGITDRMTAERKSFFATEEIVEKVNGKLKRTDSDVDVLTFVPDGEPTLDINLGDHIRALKGNGIDIAVISNASLLWMEEVRRDLSEADIVSVKVDSVVEDIWKKVNRPHGRLTLERVLEGISGFAEEYRGRLWTETMLVSRVNDSRVSLEKNAEFMNTLNAENHHITVPIRPPAEESVSIPDDEHLAMAYAVYSSKLDNVTMVTGKEEGSFGSSGNLKDDLLATCSVHPMREDSVKELVERSGGKMEDVAEIAGQGDLKIVEYQGTRFYITSS